MTLDHPVFLNSMQYLLREAKCNLNTNQILSIVNQALRLNPLKPNICLKTITLDSQLRTELSQLKVYDETLKHRLYQQVTERYSQLTYLDEASSSSTVKHIFGKLLPSPKKQ